MLYIDEAHGKYESGARSIKMPPARGRYNGEFEDLARAIRGEKKLEWTFAHDLNTHETLLSASGMPVDT